MTPALADDLALAHRLADAADELTAAAFTGEAVAHELKPDGSPVSETDLLVERRPGGPALLSRRSAGGARSAGAGATTVS